MDRMSPLDAAFLEAEDEEPTTSMAIASIAVFEGAPPPQEELLRAYESRLPMIPRYRQKVVTPLFDLGPPVWVDDPDFDLSFHVRRTALPAPGSDAAMFRLMARLMAQRLDRSRPLWECWVVEGLQDDRWAMVSKVHHCMVDGVSGTQLYHLLLSASPDEGLPDEPPEPWWPTPPPSRLTVTADAARQLALSPLRLASTVGAALTSPGKTVSKTREIGRGMLALFSNVRPAHGSTLIGDVGRQRRYDATTVNMQQVRMVCKAYDVTINDVALAAATGAFRALLLARDEQCLPNTVRSLVPVSVRARGEEGIFDNRVSCLLADLPVHVPDPVDRLRAVHSHIAHLKSLKEAEAGVVVTDMAAREPFLLVAPVLRTVFRVPQRNIVTVTTNVPGPRHPLYLLGQRMLRLQPYVPIAARVRIGVAILSYCDELTFGVTGDYDTADVELLTGQIRHAVDELVAAAATTTPTATPSATVHDRQPA
jgi:diacylglycerol O-acyltransferase